LFLRGTALTILVGATLLGAVIVQAAGTTFHASNMFYGSPTFTTAKPVYSFDISWVDSKAHRYYIADRVNASLDIFDTASNLFIARVPGFVGAIPNAAGTAVNNEVSGPDGVVTVGKTAYVGDGDSTLKVVNLETNSISDTISTGGAKRADELAVGGGLIVITNPGEEPSPFVTWISTRTHKVVARTTFDGAADAPNATDGLEQPVWHPRERAFFQPVPEVNKVPGGEIDKLDPRTRKVTARFPVGTTANPCHPQGLALAPNGDLMTGCNPNAYGAGVPRVIVLNARTGAVVTEIDLHLGGHAGPDEIWENPGDHRLYTAASTPRKLSVVDADTNTWIENIDSGPGAHSVAADSRRNLIYVPVASDSPPGFVPVVKNPECPAGCVKVFESGGTQRPVEDEDSSGNDEDTGGDNADG
jgi:hypothetical protein